MSNKLGNKEGQATRRVENGVRKEGHSTQNGVVVQKSHTGLERFHLVKYLLDKPKMLSSDLSSHVKAGLVTHISNPSADRGSGGTG